MKRLLRHFLQKNTASLLFFLLTITGYTQSVYKSINKKGDQEVWYALDASGTGFVYKYEIEMEGAKKIMKLISKEPFSKSVSSQIKENIINKERESSKLDSIENVPTYEIEEKNTEVKWYYDGDLDGYHSKIEEGINPPDNGNWFRSSLGLDNNDNDENINVEIVPEKTTNTVKKPEVIETPKEGEKIKWYLDNDYDGYHSKIIEAVDPPEGNWFGNSLGFDKDDKNENINE